MKSFTREGGTEVSFTETPADKIAAVRRIKDTRSYAKIDGVTVDLFSASAIVAVHDGLNEANRAKFLSLPIAKMALVAFKLLK